MSSLAMKDPDIDLPVVHRQLLLFAHKDDVDDDYVDREHGGEFDEEDDGDDRNCF